MKVKSNWTIEQVRMSEAIHSIAWRKMSVYIKNGQKDGQKVITFDKKSSMSYNPTRNTIRTFDLEMFYVTASSVATFKIYDNEYRVPFGLRKDGEILVGTYNTSVLVKFSMLFDQHGARVIFTTKHQ